MVHTGIRYDNATCSEGESTESVFELDREESALRLVAYISSALSMFGSAFIIFAILLSKVQRAKYPARLILYLAVSNWFFSITTLFDIPALENTVDCTIQAWTISIFATQSYLWTLAITSSLLRAIIYKDKNIEKLEKVFIPLVWIFSVAISIPPQVFGLYGYSGGWCWIVDFDFNTCTRQELGDLLRFACFYIPLWLCIVLVVTMSSVVLTSTRRQLSLASKAKKLSMRAKFSLYFHMLGYPLVMCLCWVFGTANRVVEAVTDARPHIALLILQVFFSNLQGFLNCILFGLTNSTIIKEIRQMCCSPSLSKERRGDSELAVPEGSEGRSSCSKEGEAEIDTGKNADKL
uniref:G-protein coupled receptors family 2 profile 2 domain-containing protein n=1 Tax=Palpitomonas bilix TaxID=652834 RepID=A0A7S3DF01_9EUKA|mmetsp:Transcript_3264/g.6382  ORF Transcript_3264/g.6382 Transcript_3264/m.6382 type:complete len:349 (+) Transcript_3264:385-1431(+)